MMAGYGEKVSDKWLLVIGFNSYIEYCMLMRL